MALCRLLGTCPQVAAGLSPDQEPCSKVLSPAPLWGPLLDPLPATLSSPSPVPRLMVWLLLPRPPPFPGSASSLASSSRGPGAFPQCSSLSPRSLTSTGNSPGSLHGGRRRFPQRAGASPGRGCRARCPGFALLAEDGHCRLCEKAFAPFRVSGRRCWGSCLPIPW